MEPVEVSGEQLQTEMTIKTLTIHTDSEINPNNLKPEPVLVRSMKSEPALLVKEEILEDISHDVCEQQCVYDTALPVGIGSVNETCSTSLDHLLNVKYESEDIDVGPTILQHMDVHYTKNKQNVSVAAKENSIIDDCHEAMPGSGVNKGCAEEKWEDNKATSQNCAQTTTEVDYDDEHMKSFLGHEVHMEKVVLQKHLLHQQSISSANDFKCDRTFYKPQLLSARNNLPQRNNGKAVTKGAVADSSNQSGDKGIKSKQKPFSSNFLRKGYSSKAGLNLHKRSHSSVEHKNNFVNYKFHTIQKHNDEKFVQSGDLTKNTGVLLGHKPFHCKICHAKFVQRGGLTEHMRIHTGEKPFECGMCHAKFTRRGVLTLHMRVHTGEKPYECDMCHEKFSVRGNFTNHMRVHTGEKPFECDTCHAKFSNRRSLTQHTRVHTGDKPYECDACHAKFAQKGDLTKHRRVHTGEKPYECDTCKAKFARRDNLNMHIRIHSGKKPYECDTCHAKFAERGNLNIHIRVHTGEKPYKCNACHSKFSQRSALTTHMRIHTGEKPYECDTCDAKFARRNGLTTHVRVHKGEKPYKCHTCHAMFTLSGDLTTHMRIHTCEKPHECDMCHTRFARRNVLTKHMMRVHTGEKTFECDTCHAKFAQRGALSRHLKVHMKRTLETLPI